MKKTHTTIHQYHVPLHYHHELEFSNSVAVAPIFLFLFSFLSDTPPNSSTVSKFGFGVFVV
jgi:hypothetical protein